MSREQEGVGNVPDARGHADSDATHEFLQRISGHTPKKSRYRIEGEIGRGGMGAVLKVWDEDLRRPLAMKVVLGKDALPSGDTPPVDSKVLARFLEEAQVTGQLDHPGIVPVHELGLDAAGRVYFTMRLVKGDNLRTILEHVHNKARGWNQVRALGVLLKVCEAMSYAHSKGVIHRDLKPANVMVGKFGEVYVMDWGLARVLGQADRHDLRIKEQASSTQSVVRTERRQERDTTPDSPLVTMDGDVVGTPSYMPPEQAKGQLAQLGAHSDVYSLGAMLYHLLSGQMPYVPADARVSQHAVLMAVIAGPPKPLYDLAPHAPAELLAIVDKAMARDIENRYPTMQALAEDLRAYLEGRVVAAYESGTWAETKKWIRRNKPLAASLASAVLAILAGAAAFSVKNIELRSTNVALEREKTNADELRRLAEAREEDAATRASALWSIEEARQLSDPFELRDFSNSQPSVATHLWWRQRASDLLSGTSSEAAPGTIDLRSREKYRRLLAEIRQGATPRTEAEREADRRSHPRYEEFKLLRAECDWIGRVLGILEWPDEEVTPDSEALLGANLAEARQKLADRDYFHSACMAMFDVFAPRLDPDAPALVRFGFDGAAAASPELDTGTQLFLEIAAEMDEPEALARVEVLRGWYLFHRGRFDEALEIMSSASKRMNPDASFGAEAQASLDRLRREVASLRSDEGRSRYLELSRRADALEQEVDAYRRTWYFGANRVDQWWNDNLEELLDALDTIEARLKTAELSVGSPEAVAAWQNAIREIAASPIYDGLTVSPQLDLLPLGPDPRSGLWEFAHLPSGTAPVRGPDGRLKMETESAIVLVLVPGGIAVDSFIEITDRKEHFEPGRPHPPFLLGKDVVTRAQWGRIVGEQALNPEVSQRVRDGVMVESALAEKTAWLRLPTRVEWVAAALAGSLTRESDWDALTDQTPVRCSATCGACFGYENYDSSSVSDAVGEPHDEDNDYGFHGLIHGNPVWVARARLRFDKMGATNFEVIGGIEQFKVLRLGEAVSSLRRSRPAEVSIRPARDIWP